MGKGADVFPQPLKFETALPNATDVLGVELRFPLVLPRKETQDSRIVTEIVAVKFDVGASVEALATGGTGLRVALAYRELSAAENDQTAATVSLGNIAIVDVLSFSGAVEAGGGAGTGVPNFAAYSGIYSHNLTGGTGFGYLIPGDRLFLNISTDEDLSTQTLGVVIYYRQRLIGLKEYIGILAGFQQNPS